MRWLAIAVVVGMLAAACMGDEDDAAGPTATSGVAQVAATTAATPAARPTATETASVSTQASPSTSRATATATTATSPETTATAAPPSAELTCGAEITASVTLANDLDCDPVALVVTGNDVVLDLGGHTITGAGVPRRSWPLPNFDIAGVIVRGDNVTVRNGTISATGIALLVNGAGGATIQGLSTTGNYYGIYLYQGGGHTVDGNSVRDNVYGLHFQESNGNTATNNDLSAQTHHSPGGYGLYLYSSNGNHFEGNTVRENLNWGLWFSDSSENTIVRNNIIGNDPQVSDDTGGNLYFDEATREGNFWSDYQGDDANSDGIGDLPYAIGGPGRSADPYPFMAEDGWRGRTSQTVAVATPAPAPAIAPRFYVPTEDGIAVVDPAAGALLVTFDARLMGATLATSPDGTRLYGVAGDAGEVASVVAVDTESGAVVDSWEMPGALVVAATYDGERVLVSTGEGLSEVVLDTGEIRRQHDGANAVAITPSWKHNLALVTDSHWFVHVVYLPDQHVPYKFSLAGKPLQVVDNRAGTRLFAVIDGQQHVSIIDTEQFLETDQVPLHGIPAANARIAPSPDGTTLYVLDTATSRLIAIDLATKQVTTDVTISGEAVDLAVSANGKHVAVAVAADDAGRVALFDADLAPTGSVDLDSAPRGVIAPR